MGEDLKFYYFVVENTESKGVLKLEKQGRNVDGSSENSQIWLGMGVSKTPYSPLACLSSL